MPSEQPKKPTEADFPVSRFVYDHRPTEEETAYYRQTGKVMKGLGQLAGYPEDLAMKVKHGLITMGQAKLRLKNHPMVSYSDMRQAKSDLIMRMEDFSRASGPLHLKTKGSIFNKDGSDDKRFRGFRNK